MSRNSRFCSVCMKMYKKPIKRCGGCQQVYYCSKQCQVKDWKFHKPICGKNKTLEKKKDEFPFTTMFFGKPQQTSNSKTYQSQSSFTNHPWLGYFTEMNANLVEDCKIQFEVRTIKFTK